MKIELLTWDKIPLAIELIGNTFLQFVAPDYSEEGVKAFSFFFNDEKMINSMEFFGAFEDDELKGVLSVNNNRSHICCLFVKASDHNRGIAKNLLKFLLANNDNYFYTVNSSPYAVGFYEAIGFESTGIQQVLDGIKFTPMKYQK